MLSHLAEHHEHFLWRIFRCAYCTRKLLSPGTPRACGIPTSSGHRLSTESSEAQLAAIRDYFDRLATFSDRLEYLGTGEPAIRNHWRRNFASRSCQIHPGASRNIGPEREPRASTDEGEG